MRPITSERYPLAGPAYQPTLKLTGDAAPEIFAARSLGPVRGSRWRTLGSRCVRAIRRFVVRAALPEPLAALRALMLNLRWSWHSSTRELFAAMDPAGRAEAGRDPAALLGEVPPEHLAQLAADPGYLARLAEAESELEEYLTGPRWYQRGGNELTGAPAAVAYFSPEYGIASALPQYSGGLGILAGDHLKAASDLGVPLIGVGLLYRHGYFSQSLSAEGWQQEHYPGADPNGLPLTLLREASGSPVRVAVTLAEGWVLAAQVWLAQVGRVPLLLLDSYVEENEPALREVTDRLYGGGSEHRLRQELLLGIGGVRAVRAFCALTGHPQPEVFHTNEGHAGFLGLERIREYAQAGLSFDEAIEVCRAGTVFTTHTPVAAGIDRFPRTLIEQHFSGPAGDPALPTDRVLALGAETYPGGDPEVFNMAVMGMRLAQRVNGVSRLHGRVSRAMFAGLWPGFDPDEVPIGSVTNGVHAATWVAPEIRALAAGDGGSAGPELAEDGEAWERVAAAGPARLWEIRRLLRGRLVDLARERLRASWRQRGASDAELGWVQGVLDPSVLTIGFARRVPSYKRLTLMLHDPVRLRALLLDPERPVQIVIAGKAHPADESGKQLIQQMVRFADSEDVRHRIVFLPDYDMGLAHALVQGCDVWLNNPLRPLEACGTSGMKSALNGGLNLSIRDGWWDEWYDGENGWQIPSADGVADADRRDELESAGLYEMVETVVAPQFYDAGDDGLPARWLEMVAHTFRTLGPLVQASRMVRDYVTGLYVPGARASRLLTAEQDGSSFAAARELAAWKHQVSMAWDEVRIEHVEADDGRHGPGDALLVRASVALGKLSPADVAVEVVCGRVDSGDEIVEPVASGMSLAEASGEAGIARYEGRAGLRRPGPFGYTVRVVPRHPLLTSSAELGLVTFPQAPAGMTNGDLR
jgi:glycogen phosphorylase